MVAPKVLINIAEIYNETCKQTSKEMVVGCLKHHDNKALRQILKLNYDATCNIKITDEELKLRPNIQKIGQGQTCLLYSASKAYVFFEEYEPKITHEKRTLILAEMLEHVDQEEQKVYLLAKNKKLEIPFITAKDINDIFPKLIEKPYKAPAKRGSKKSTTEEEVASA